VIGASIVLYRTAAREVGPLVDSLLAQGVTRVYLVDNSPPEFPTTLGWSARANVELIRTGENLGYGRAHNIAIRRSAKAHRYHLVSNPDIELRPGAIPRLRDALEARPDVGLAMPRVVGTDGKIHYLCKRPPSPLDLLVSRLAPRHWFAERRKKFETRDLPYDQERSVECLSGCFMFFRASTLEALGGFDERFFMYMEDFDLSRRAARLQQNVYLPSAEVVHVHASGHRGSPRLLMSAIASAVRYYNKWGWLERRRDKAAAKPADSV
jgi:GT2 family glycosyltransferase